MTKNIPSPRDPQQFWCCPICGTPFQNIDAAKTCADTHVDPQDITIVGLNFDSLKPFPSSVTLQIKGRGIAEGHVSMVKYERITEK